MRYFSTFTGIGGFEIGIHNAFVRHQDQDLQRRTGRTRSPYRSSEQLSQFSVEGLSCVGYSEINEPAISVYEKHFKGVKNYGDITQIKTNELPDFDCLVGGFPCQAFSIAGKRQGFDDTRGTLFFDLARILQAKRPGLFVFENVKGLLSHDSGKTFRTIITTLTKLGYDTQWQVLNSKDFGVPQNRERIIIVGHLRGQPRPKVFPFTGADEEDTRITGQDVAYALDAGYAKGVGPDLSRARRSLVEVGTLRTHKDGQGFRTVKSGLAPTVPARARQDGSGQPVVLVPEVKYGGGQRSIKHRESDTVPTIRATHYKAGDNQPKIKVREATRKGYAEAGVGDAINLNQPNSKTRRGRVAKISPTIDTKMDIHTLTNDVRIRRLTPVECERLQAFPDDWTKYSVDGKIISDSQRYKMCGNAVTTNVIQAVFERIFT